MSEDDTVDFARHLISNEHVTREIFVTLRKYYANNEPDVKFILNLLEASILNAISERQFFLKLFKNVFEIENNREQVLTDMHDETHKFEKQFKDFKEREIEDIVKKFTGGYG